jgi:hypothetical protein
MAGLLLLVMVGLAAPVAVEARQKDKDKAKPEPASPLAWKFKEGDVFYQEMYTETNQTMVVTKTDVAQKQKQTFWFSYKVTKKEGSKVTLDQKIEGVKMEIDIGGNTIAYDSTKENATANNPLADYFKALQGSKFTLTLDTKTMKVTDLEGSKDFRDKLLQSNPQMKALLETILSDKALKEMAEPTFGIVPNEPVTKGKKWERKSTLDMGPIGTYENTYKYEYLGTTKGDEHKIKVTPILEYKEPAADVAQGGLPFRIVKAKLTSTAPKDGGTILFDGKTGRLVKSEVKVELKGDLTIEIGGTKTPVSLSQTQTSIVKALDPEKLPFKTK